MWQQGVLSLGSDSQQPVLADWEPKSALQGWSNDEGESVANIHKDGGVTLPWVSGQCGWPLPIALACPQFIPCVLAVTIGGRTQCDLHLCQVWGEGLSSASVSSRHLSGEAAYSESLLNSTRLGSHLVWPSLSVSVQVYPQIYVPHNPQTTLEEYPCKNKNCPWPLSLTFWPLPFLHKHAVCLGFASWLMRLGLISALRGHLKIMWLSGTQKHRHIIYISSVELSFLVCLEQMSSWGFLTSQKCICY